MSRIAIAPWLILVPGLALADAPPPDHFGPCQGKQAGQTCASSCTCVVYAGSCPQDAGTCLSCERGAGQWCGPSSSGCSTGAPFASLVGVALIVSFAYRRRLSAR